MSASTVTKLQIQLNVHFNNVYPTYWGRGGVINDVLMLVLSAKTLLNPGTPVKEKRVTITLD